MQVISKSELWVSFVHYQYHIFSSWYMADEDILYPVHIEVGFEIAAMVCPLQHMKANL